ncbi:hypothetical protein FA13DRAFT_1778809 [Coprinellus micaceus]|uniref:Uncharacterized protein n=1 Tax=Coprinellus micaceus TaxID=71717 RepID=A0A4Y7SKK4_COPMI|nr:hypothetical protein FA13DRAFT_1778809 [Coprinellus micaceus]
MSKYDEPDVIYRGYMISMEKFNQTMKKIPAYRRLMTTQYGEHSHTYCYCHWKNAVLDEKLKKRAPKIKEHSVNGNESSVEGTHMMLLLGYIDYLSPSQVEDPNHPTAESLVERDSDRKAIENFVRFFQNRGAKDLRPEDFTFGWSIGENPCLLTRSYGDLLLVSMHVLWISGNVL